MDVTLLREQLRQSEERNEALGREVASLRAEFAALRRDYESLVDATRMITDERNVLRQRVAELEAANNRLTDMLWGRRSERRSESPNQQHLDFGDGPMELPGAEEQEIITAQAETDEARDRELLKRLEARRKARREQAQGREEFPPTIERRERVLDLAEEQKRGLTLIGVKTTERLRFEKPHVYVEVIKRPQYVVAGQPEKGVRSVPPPLSIVEGCKYDFSVVAAMAGLKFAFHVPTYRQQDWFAQCGWFPSRSTANDLMNYAADTVGPLYQQMWQLLLAQPILLGDDTTLCVLLRERGKTLDAAARHQLRQREAVPIWNRMRRWLDGDAAQRALPRSRIGEALGYLRNQWSALTVYLGDPRIPIDNAQAEQIIRPLTVGRANWQFLGHPKAAAGRLQLYSVVSSAHRHHLMIDDYLEDVLRKLADAQQNHPVNLELGSPYLAELLPDRWALTHPQSVRENRAEDRQVAFEAKRWRRARARMLARATKAGP